MVVELSASADFHDDLTFCPYDKLDFILCLLHDSHRFLNCVAFQLAHDIGVGELFEHQSDFAVILPNEKVFHSGELLSFCERLEQQQFESTKPVRRTLWFCQLTSKVDHWECASRNLLDNLNFWWNFFVHRGVCYCVWCGGRRKSSAILAAPLHRVWVWWRIRNHIQSY